MLNEAVKKVLSENMWDLATCSDNMPNVVPVAFKDVTADGKLAVGDVFLETTLKNLRENGGKIAVSVYDAKSLEGYQIKGTAEYITSGAVVETFQKMVESMFHGQLLQRVPYSLHRKRLSSPHRVRRIKRNCKCGKHTINSKIVLKKVGFFRTIFVVIFR